MWLSRNAYIAGSVGIGTTSTVKKLDVVGDVNATGAVYSLNGYYIGTNQIITSARVLQNIASISQSLLPTTDNSYDLGSSSLRWRNAYFSGTIYGNVQGSITSTGNLNMNNYDIYNIKNVNTTNLFATGNVGIGTTNPDATLTIGSGNNIRFIAGSQPQFNLTNLAGGGSSQFNRWTNRLELVTTDAFSITNSVGGTPALWADATTGNVGIGTTAPATKLHVAGGWPTILIETTDLTYSALGHAAGKSGFGFLTNTGAAANVNVGGLAITSSYFVTPPTNGLYVQGNVGIGTTTPLTKLDVVGNVNASIYYDRENPARYLDPSGTSVIGAMNMYGDLNMNNYNINGIGNLYGYGTLNYYPSAVTTNPAHVFKSGDGTNWVDRLTIGGNAATVDVSISNSNFVVNSNQLYVRRSDGNVGIGTTSPGGKLHVIATSSTSGLVISNDTVARSFAYWDATNNRLVIQVA